MHRLHTHCKRTRSPKHRQCACGRMQLNRASYPGGTEVEGTLRSGCLPRCSWPPCGPGTTAPPPSATSTEGWKSWASWPSAAHARPRGQNVEAPVLKACVRFKLTSNPSGRGCRRAAALASWSAALLPAAAIRGKRLGWARALAKACLLVQLTWMSGLVSACMVRTACQRCQWAVHGAAVSHNPCQPSATQRLSV